VEIIWNYNRILLKVSDKNAIKKGKLFERENRVLLIFEIVNAIHEK